MSHDNVELAFIVVAALALVAQTIVLLAFAAGMAKAVKSIKAQVEEVHTAVMPVVHTTRALVDRLSPKVESAITKVESTITDVSEVAHTLRAQAADVQAALEQILVKVQKQSSRVDSMFSSTLDAVDKAAGFVTSTVAKPVRQIAGLLAGLKAVAESLRASDPAYREPTLRNDKDLFV